MGSLTLGDHFAKHRHRLERGAVPSTVPKLKLTLVYRQLGSTTHRIHHLHTALTDLNLEHKHTAATSNYHTEFGIRYVEVWKDKTHNGSTFSKKHIGFQEFIGMYMTHQILFHLYNLILHFSCNVGAIFTQV